MNFNNTESNLQQTTIQPQVEDQRKRKHTFSVVSSQSNETSKSHFLLPQTPTSTNSQTPTQRIMLRRSSGSSSTSNDSNHHARKTREAIFRLYANRQASTEFLAARGNENLARHGLFESNTSVPKRNDSGRPKLSDSDLSSTASESTIRPNPRLPLSKHAHVLSPTLWIEPERRPLLPVLSPQVSPLVTQHPILHSNRDSTHPEPFLDLESGNHLESDSSYEGLEVFGRRLHVRRRWDLGPEQAHEQRQSWYRGFSLRDGDGLLTIYLLGVFVVGIVGGGGVLVWALLHQNGWYVGGKN